MIEKTKYRNNYVPVRELSGIIQQMEKYLYCLSTVEKSKDIIIEKTHAYLPDGVTIEIVSPKGILLLGRSKGFNSQQKKDFEIIKRQYKNIADIMTYDDLLKRIDNMISALEKRMNPLKYCSKGT